MLNAKALGLGLTAIVYISMDKHIPERFDLFEQEITVNDLEHYYKILVGKITKISGVAGVHSSFILNKVIENRALPIY